MTHNGEFVISKFIRNTEFVKGKAHGNGLWGEKIGC